MRGNRTLFLAGLLVLATLASGCTLNTWGRNSDGQLGNGTTTDVSVPSPSDTSATRFNDWIDIDAGNHHACGVRATGTLWCWGRDTSEQLANGAGDVTERFPSQVGTNSSWTATSASAISNCALRANETLWCWGNNFSGELGDGTTTDRSTPTKVANPSGGWVGVSGVSSHRCGIRSNNTLWCWGNNFNGQLGDGTTTNRPSPVQIAGTTWSAVAAGAGHTCAVKTNQTLWCWGYNNSGAIGDGTRTDRPNPVQVGTATNWTTPYAGYGTSCGLQTDQTLACWGSNSNGTLGVGDYTSRLSPTTVGTDTWQSFDLSRHACGVTTAGEMNCWGDNFETNLAIYSVGGDLVNVPTPVGTSSNWAAVGVGDYSCGLRIDNTAWCWGYQPVEQLGIAVSPDEPAPAQVGETDDWITVSGGDSHSCGVRSTNTLWCWGDNTYDQINSDASDPTRPVRVTQSIATVDAGVSHTCAVRLDGGLNCWGHNAHGQLGLGDTNSRPSFGSFTSVDGFGATNWKSVSAGERHTCAIKTSGTLWCWGDALFGQLGTGTTTDSLVPVQVGSASNWARVSADYNHTCAVRTNNTLFCWGYNGGRLGDGTSAQRNSPVQIGGAIWQTVAAGGTQTCATQINGSLWCWGLNNRGQLGDDTTTQRLTPVQVGTSTQWTNVTTGYNFGCGLQSGIPNTAWCWGANNNGRLGDGTAVQRNSPVAVGAGSNWILLQAGGGHVVAAEND